MLAACQAQGTSESDRESKVTETSTEDRRVPDYRDLAGWLLIDKASGPTSRDALNKIQWRWRKLKVGHAGTLDPLATGLLLVAVGSATRLVDITHRLDKTYEARIRLGATSPTDDADGQWVENREARPVAQAELEAALADLTGPEIMQTPPSFSAVHVKGKRAYELARKGQDVELTARPVRVDRIVIKQYTWPFLDVVVECGAGTYIRSIARDLGTMLGVGGMIQTLRRTRIGPFAVEQAQAISTLLECSELGSQIRPSAQVLEGWPKVILNEETRMLVARGRPVPMTDPVAGLVENQEVALVDAHGALAALAKAVASESGFWAQPHKVFLEQD